MSDSANTYSMDSQRLTQRDLAFNGLADKHSFAAPSLAAPSDLAAAHDTVARLAGEASGREFTTSEQQEWQTALGTQASHYAAEEARAR